MRKSNLFDLSSIEPGPFIAEYFEWIFFTCLLLIFFGIVGIALRKQFKDSRALKVLITGTSLLISLLLYYSIYTGSLNLNPEGFALYGAMLIFILLFSIMFIILQMFTDHKARAFMLSFLITYIVAWSISDQFFQMIAEIAPILNGIMKIIATLCLVFLVIETIGHFKFNTNSSGMLNRAADKLRSYKPERKVKAEKEIKSDIKTDKKDKKQVKTDLKETKREIKTIDDMHDNLNDMESVIKKKGNELDQKDIGRIRNIIRSLSNEEKALDKSDLVLIDGLNLHKLRHTKQLDEIRNRLVTVKDNKERATLLAQIDDHKKALDMIIRIKNQEEKTKAIHREFRRNMSFAMTRLNENRAPATVEYIDKAKHYLSEMQSAIKGQRSMEQDLLDITKKTIYDLKQEKNTLDA